MAGNHSGCVVSSTVVVVVVGLTLSMRCLTFVSVLPSVQQRRKKVKCEFEVETQRQHETEKNTVPLLGMVGKWVEDADAFG